MIENGKCDCNRTLVACLLKKKKKRKLKRIQHSKKNHIDSAQVIRRCRQFIKKREEKYNQTEPDSHFLLWPYIYCLCCYSGIRHCLITINTADM